MFVFQLYGFDFVAASDGQRYGFYARSSGRTARYHLHYGTKHNAGQIKIMDSNRFVIIIVMKTDLDGRREWLVSSERAFRQHVFASALEIEISRVERLEMRIAPYRTHSRARIVRALPFSRIAFAVERWNIYKTFIFEKLNRLQTVAPYCL